MRAGRLLSMGVALSFAVACGQAAGTVDVQGPLTVLKTGTEEASETTDEGAATGSLDDLRPYLPSFYERYADQIPDRPDGCPAVDIGQDMPVGCLGGLDDSAVDDALGPLKETGTVRLAGFTGPIAYYGQRHEERALVVESVTPAPGAPTWQATALVWNGTDEAVTVGGTVSLRGARGIELGRADIEPLVSPARPGEVIPVIVKSDVPTAAVETAEWDATSMDGNRYTPDGDSLAELSITTSVELPPGDRPSEDLGRVHADEGDGPYPWVQLFEITNESRTATDTGLRTHVVVVIDDGRIVHTDQFSPRQLGGDELTAPLGPRQIAETVLVIPPGVASEWASPVTLSWLR